MEMMWEVFWHIASRALRYLQVGRMFGGLGHCIEPDMASDATSLGDFEQTSGYPLRIKEQVTLAAYMSRFAQLVTHRCPFRTTKDRKTVSVSFPPQYISNVHQYFSPTTNSSLPTLISLPELSATPVCKINVPSSA